MIRVEIQLDVLEDRTMSDPPASLAKLTHDVEDRLDGLGTIVTLNAERRS